MMVVMMAMLVLLPLALTLLTMVSARFRQTVLFRDLIQQELSARAGLTVAGARLSSAGRLADGEGQSFTVEDVPVPVTVRVERAPDVVLALDGRTLAPGEASSVDVNQVVTDPEGRRVFLYRKLQVYVVESTVPARAPVPGVRLRAVLVRKPDGSLAQIGVKLERGFFERVP